MEKRHGFFLYSSHRCLGHFSRCYQVARELFTLSNSSPRGPCPLTLIAFAGQLRGSPAHAFQPLQTLPGREQPPILKMPFRRPLYFCGAAHPEELRVTMRSSSAPTLLCISSSASSSDGDTSPALPEGETPVATHGSGAASYLRYRMMQTLCLPHRRGAHGVRMPRSRAFSSCVADGDGDNFMSSTASPSSFLRIIRQQAQTLRGRLHLWLLWFHASITIFFATRNQSAGGSCDVLLTMRASFCLARSPLTSSVSLFPLVSRSRTRQLALGSYGMSSMPDRKDACWAKIKNTPCLVSTFPIST